jgi:cytochrome c oxidase assembly protein subunit 15
MTSQISQLKPLGLRLLGITLFTQAGIVVTGALVRLTGSGLGCPTWPRCTAESYVPEPSQVEGFNKWIEFGNRLLTFVVAIAAIASLIYVLRQWRRFNAVSGKFALLAAIPFLGTIAQAVVGGITVLMDLNPYTVAIHFLLSIFIIAVAARTRVIAQYSARKQDNRISSLLATLLLLAGFVVIFLGVITTGSGPHAGDVAAVRFGFDVATVAWLHADAVWFFTGLLIANFLINRNRTLIKIVLIVILQIVVGYAQWFTGLPWLLVAAHVALAVTLWVWLVKFHTLNTRLIPQSQ